MIGAPREIADSAFVAGVIATWNRKDDALRAVAALSRQTAGAARLHVVVVDNAGTDGTWEALVERFGPETQIENRARDGSEFRFVNLEGNATRNGAGFASMTLVRNLTNLGGTGGFNAGMAYIRDVLDLETVAERPRYFWLLDDDAEVRADALAMLLGTISTDPKIGIVGSRSVDPGDRETTLETTVFFDRATGHFRDDAPAGHPSHESHRQWLATGVRPRGRYEYKGVVATDICAAASVLARIEVLREVGLWDHRFFLYEDDADWCLRAAAAGWRVVCDLDAVVYHRTWHARLTPRLFQTRLSYVARNRVWLMQHILQNPERKRGCRAWVLTALKDAARANRHRRATHAELLLRAVASAISGNGGKIPIALSPSQNVMDALRASGAFRPGARVVVMCDRPGFAESSEALRARVEACITSGAARGDVMPEWAELVRNDLTVPAASPRVRRIIYSSRVRSKWRRQLGFLLRPPAAIIIFDAQGDFPLIRGGTTLHIDRASPDTCEVEHGSLWQRLWFACRWAIVRAKVRRVLR